MSALIANTLTLALLSGAALTVTATFNPYEHLGNLSPYFDAPNLSGLSVDLPASCSVQQVSLMQRHGSRYPLGSELSPFITGLVSKLANASSVLSSSKAIRNLPSELQFLTKGYTSSLGVNDLTAPGRQELFNAGVEWRLKYESLTTEALPITLLAGNQDRVVESAEWFREGFLGRTANSTSTLNTINEDSVTESWITPMDTCSLWQYAYGNNATVAWGTHYLPPITTRLNKLFSSTLPSPGLSLTTADVHGALYACAYDYAAFKKSPWCAVFEEQEILDFEYELDLLMQGAFGYGLPGDMGPLLGRLYTRKLVERFTGSNSSSPVILEFGHDTTIDLALTGLGLIKDSSPLVLPTNPPHTIPNPRRKWRTSYQVPFAARLVWEKFSCSSSSQGFKANTPYMRVLLNNAPISLEPVCGSSKTAGKYGACALADFVKSSTVQLALNDATGSYKGTSWNTTCGVTA